jgi:hypothetical protein
VTQREANVLTGYQAFKQFPSRGGNFIDCLIEDILILAGWLAVSADFPDVLKGCSLDFFIGGRVLWLAELFDISAHGSFSLSFKRIFSSSIIGCASEGR